MSTIFRLQELREAAGLSQSALARLIGAQQPSINNWERGVQCPVSWQLPRLAAALDCSIDDLFTEEAKADARHEMAVRRNRLD